MGLKLDISVFKTFWHYIEKLRNTSDDLLFLILILLKWSKAVALDKKKYNSGETIFSILAYADNLILLV